MVEQSEKRHLTDWTRQLRQQRVRRLKLRRRGLALGALCTLLLATAAIDPRPWLVWNVSRSAPLGLYGIGPRGGISVGDMVLARVPDHARRLAAVRHYIPQNVPMLKRVTARSGDYVCARKERIFINGKLVAVRRIADVQGRPMPWWNGCVRLHEGQLFLLMANPSSFDGRYFGPTEPGDVIGSAHLLWAR